MWAMPGGGLALRKIFRGGLANLGDVLTETGGASEAARTIIFHYHYFKNAGTSLDAMLKQNFGPRWTHAEFKGLNNSAEVQAWVAAAPEAAAFSSHTAQFPVPVISGLRVIPVLFVRHPLDRIASAYRFERRQQAEGLGAALAKAHDLAGYIKVRLDNVNDRQCRDFHVFRMAKQQSGAKPADLDAALKTMMELPFVGVVEEYELSLQALETVLKPHFPAIQCRNVRLNAASDLSMPLAARLAAMKAEIGVDLYRRLVAANMKDICLHQAAVTKLRELSP
jgi:hypothetical protein